MATDWTARTAAIDLFEKIVKRLKACNDEDKELYEAALHALRRSQDHTAIQTKLQTAMNALRFIKELSGECMDNGDVRVGTAAEVAMRHIWRRADETL